MLVVRFLLELELAGVGHEVEELLGKALGELLESSIGLLQLDLLVLAVLVLGRQTLPGEAAPQEVHYNESNLLEVVFSRLLNSHVSVQGGVASSSC